ncbi:Oidioi.mRNA.OKI2018_I69.XSR.g14065.t2.cds [Oikopleura dioica]|uniref:Oidioi.mRNA.OKI2018_I69.XSR.g14065.t2.cds n=1 Tax=Oikopleura dioica TaxID=34765 RepID=A0ABN7SCJ5_OIKDI|nr:Oidioi.mRNA.OKI2018_I69.XSR.g14065.t2.cds [Oikopleura dioica]
MFRFTALARPALARAVSVRPLSVSVQNLLGSDAVFAKMGDKIDAAAVAKVKGVFRFDIQEKKKTVKTWTADLKNGDGSLVEGEGTKPDVTIIVSDEDFVKLAAGELDAQKAFFSGKLKVKGNIMLSQKLGAILKN